VKGFDTTQKRTFEETAELWFQNKLNHKYTSQNYRKIFPYLIMERGNHCAKCGTIPTEIHHVDGDRKNNGLSNFMILCAECHHGFHRKKRA